MEMFTITTWNINGIRSSKNLKAMLDSLDSDIICLQETKITREMLTEPLAIVPGYSSYFDFCQRRSGYSGVATFCREAARPLAAEPGLAGSRGQQVGRGQVGCYGELEVELAPAERAEMDAEGRCVVTLHQLSCQCSGGAQDCHLAVINVYCPRVDPDRPERLQYKLRFYRALQLRAAAVRAAGHHVLVVGDLNCTHRPIDTCDPGDLTEFQLSASRQFLNGWLRSPEDRTEPSRLVALSGDITPPSGDTARSFLKTTQSGNSTQSGYSAELPDGDVGSSDSPKNVSGFAWSYEKATPSPDATASSQDDSTLPPDTARPPDDTARPPDNTARPPGDTARPPDDTAKPLDDTSGPPDDTAGHPDHTAGSPDDITNPQDDAARPPDDTARPPDNTAGPPDDTARPPDGTAKPLDDTAGSRDDTANPPDDAATRAADTDRLVDTFRHMHPSAAEVYTCWNTQKNARANNYGTRIDYILSDGRLAAPLLSCHVLADVHGSDHCPVRAAWRGRLLAAPRCPPACSRFYPEFAGRQVTLKEWCARLPAAAKRTAAAPSAGPPKRVRSGQTTLLGFVRRAVPAGGASDGGRGRPGSTEVTCNGRSPQAGSGRVAEEGRSAVGKCADQVQQTADPCGGGGHLKGDDRDGQLDDLYVAMTVASGCHRLDLADTADLDAETAPGAGEVAQVFHGADRSPQAAVEARQSRAAADFWRQTLRVCRPPACRGHREPCVRRVVKKAGPNLGKVFWCCARGVGKPDDPQARCGHFEWIKRR